MPDPKNTKRTSGVHSEKGRVGSNHDKMKDAGGGGGGTNSMPVIDQSSSYSIGPLLTNCRIRNMKPPTPLCNPPPPLHPL